MKAQSAIEYLLSYAWALLAIVAIIVVLLMIGLPNLRNSEPERCSFLTDSMGCESIRLDNGASGNTLRIRDLAVSNNFNKKIYVCGIICSQAPLQVGMGACGQTAGKPVIDAGKSVQVVANGQMPTIAGSITCTDETNSPFVPQVGSIYRGKLYIFHSYSDETGGLGAHVSTGELVARTQATVYRRDHWFVPPA